MLAPPPRPEPASRTPRARARTIGRMDRAYLWGPTTATHVLVVSGTLFILAALFLGLTLGMRRRRATLAESHYFLAAHEGAIQQGLLCYALSLGLGFSSLSPGTETIAAWLIVVAGTLSVLSAVVNGLQGIQDQFAEKSLGWRLATVNAMLVLPGVIIVTVGVFKTVFADGT